MTSAERKEKRESAIVDRAKKHYSFFPEGQVRKREKPDFQIDEASLGIEVTELLSMAGPGQFEGTAISSFHKRVIKAARQYYLKE